MNCNKQHTSHCRISEFYQDKYIESYSDGVFGKSRNIYFLSLSNYLQGFIELEDLDITAKNVFDFIAHAKLFDWAIAFSQSIGWLQNFPNTIYHVQRRILKLFPRLTLPEVMMRTLNFEKIRHKDFWLDHRMWPTEHEAKKGKLQVLKTIMARSLSERLTLKYQHPVLIAFRGTTGSRKTTHIKKKVGELTGGVLNLDDLKEGIRGGDLRNSQVHPALAEYFNRKFYRELADNTNLSIVRDSRLSDYIDVVNEVICPAKLQGRVVKFTDLDVKFESSANCALGRISNGKESKDAVPDLDGIKNGFLRIRKNRRQIIRLLIEEEIVDEYELYHKGELVAAKINGRFRAKEDKHHLIEECLREPTTEEMEKLLNRKIDQKYIQEARDRKDLYEGQYKRLEYWCHQKVTVREALERHALGEDLID